MLRPENIYGCRKNPRSKNKRAYGRMNILCNKMIHDFVFKMHLRTENSVHLRCFKGRTMKIKDKKSHTYNDIHHYHQPSTQTRHQQLKKCWLHYINERTIKSQMAWKLKSSKTMDTIMFYKKKYSDGRSNYRPISLLIKTVKVVTRTLNTSLRPIINSLEITTSSVFDHWLGAATHWSLYQKQRRVLNIKDG